MASAIVRNPSVIALDRDQCDRLLAAVLRDQPLVSNIVLTDPEGAIRGTGIAGRTTIGETVGLPYVQDVVASGKPVVTELQTGVVSGKPIVVLAYPVRDAAEAVVAVLAIGVNLERLQTLFWARGRSHK